MINNAVPNLAYMLRTYQLINPPIKNMAQPIVTQINTLPLFTPGMPQY